MKNKKVICIQQIAVDTVIPIPGKHIFNSFIETLEKMFPGYRYWLFNYKHNMKLQLAMQENVFLPRKKNMSRFILPS